MMIISIVILISINTVSIYIAIIGIIIISSCIAIIIILSFCTALSFIRYVCIITLPIQIVDVLSHEDVAVGPNIQYDVEEDYSPLSLDTIRISIENGLLLSAFNE